MTLLASEPLDDTDSLSSLSDDVLSNYDSMDNPNQRHSLGGTDTPLSSSPSPSSSRLEGLSESIRSTHEKLATGSSSSNPLDGPTMPTSSSHQHAQADRQHQAIAPSINHSSRPPLSTDLDHEGTGDPDAEASEPSQPRTPRPAGGPVLTKEWTIPPRPKPGRKPATDVPTSKRREQNRVAQRAYRERGKVALEKYERESKIKDDAYQRELETLRTQLNQNMATASHFKVQTENYKAVLADMSGQRHALEAEVSMLQHKLRDVTAEKETIRRENESLRRPREGVLGNCSGNQTPYSSGLRSPRNGGQNGIYSYIDDLYSNTVTPNGLGEKCLNCNGLARTCECLEETQKRQMDEFNRGPSRRPSDVTSFLPSPPIIDDRRFSARRTSSTRRPGISHGGLDELYPAPSLSRLNTNSTDKTARERPNLSRLNTNATKFSEMEIDFTNIGRSGPNANADPYLPSATGPEKEDCGFCTDTFRGPGGIDCLCKVAKDGPAPPAPILDAVPLKRKPSAAPTTSDTSPYRKKIAVPVSDIERTATGIEPGSCYQCQLDPNSRKFCIEAAANSQMIQKSQDYPGVGSSSEMERTKSCDEVYQEIRQHPNFSKGIENNPQQWLSELKVSPANDPSHAQLMDAASVLCCLKALDSMTDADWQKKT